MLLRRMIDHVKAQNWTAIILDFLIVVSGVFIGIQVSNWNEARNQSAQEKSQLTQLRDEIARNQEVFENQALFVAEIISSGRRALAYLEGGEDCSSECADLLIDFFHASQVWGSEYETAKFRDNEQLGFPSSPATRDAVQSVYLFLSGWGAVNLTPPAFRERVRGYFSPEASAALWDRCQITLERQFEILSRDCKADLEPLENAGMLRAIRADLELAPQLRFWLGQNIWASQEYVTVQRLSANALAALNGEIGDAQ